MPAGGEDGAVKLLDVFYKRRKCSGNPPIATDDASCRLHPMSFPNDGSCGRFHRPYAKLVQTLPSHESSVGALAVGVCGGGSNSDKESLLKSTLVVSGGGKLEVRAWQVGRDGSGNETGAHRDCSPPVRRRLLVLLPLPVPVDKPFYSLYLSCLLGLSPHEQPLQYTGYKYSKGRAFSVIENSWLCFNPFSLSLSLSLSLSHFSFSLALSSVSVQSPVYSP